MKIAIIGECSDKNKVDLFNKYGLELAQAALNKGFEILIVNPDDNFIEATFCSLLTIDNTNQFSICCHKRKHEVWHEKLANNSNEINISSIGGINDEDNDEMNYFTSYANNIISADCIIVVGGSELPQVHSLRALLHLSANKIIPIESFGGLGEELRNQYIDKINQNWNIRKSTSNTDIINKIHDKLSKKHDKVTPNEKIFISYSRNQPEKADFIELLLRRKGNYEIIRDDISIETNSPLSMTIKNYIKEASIFIAIYNKDYISSTWCYDELDYAIENSKDIWLFNTDNTPIIHPKYRGKKYIDALNRIAVENELNNHLIQKDIKKYSNVNISKINSDSVVESLLSSLTAKHK